MNIPIEKVIELRRGRKTWAEIAEICGCSRQAVRNFAKGFPDFPPDLLNNMNRYHQVSAEDLEAMVNRGMSDSEMAKSLNMSRDALERLRERRGIFRSDKRNHVNRLSQEKLSRIESLLDEGYSYNAIASMTGSSSKTISRNFPGRGFTVEQATEARSMGRALEKIRA